MKVHKAGSDMAQTWLYLSVNGAASNVVDGIGQMSSLDPLCLIAGYPRLAVNELAAGSVFASSTFQKHSSHLLLWSVTNRARHVIHRR
jgi:hypothetical protein